MHPQKPNIVILGGGFAGLQTALHLSKKLRGLPHRILLIDQRNTHLYTPDLYEIATAYHDEITEACLTQLKDAVAVPFEKILHGTSVEFLRDEAVKILPRGKTVLLKTAGTLGFDFLVIALGSTVNYYGIPGLEEYATPLKTLLDGLALNCHLDMHFHRLWKKEAKKKVAIVVGGGGATGVELACELPGCLDKLCRKYSYPRHDVGITVVEASESLAGQQDSKTTRAVLKRFEKLGIEAQLNTSIRSVDESGLHVETAPRKKETLPADLLIWTGGVKPHPLIGESFSEIAKNGALPVNEYLCTPEFPQIFAAGDNAFFCDPKTGRPAPLLAQIAFQQGRIVAENIAAQLLGKKGKPYRIRFKGAIIPLGGRHALLKKGRFVWTGFFPWLLRRLVDLRYALSILPFRYALKKWIHDTHIFVGND